MSLAFATESPLDKRRLVVDLDGTLIRSDLLMEMAFGFIGQSPLAALRLPLWLWQGRAVLKRRLAEAVPVDIETLPYDEAVLARIRAARAQGHAVYLASASDARVVEAVSDHLGLFDGWFASDGRINLSGRSKADRLVDAFGEGNFDYIGNGRIDLPVWERAASAIAVGTSAPVERELARRKGGFERIATEPSRYGWLKVLRPHQWAKNVLVGVPLLTAHQFTPTAIVLTVLAAIAFSLCASATYILNDLIDIGPDRGHPTKRMRPFARGELSFTAGALMALVCLTVGISIAALISWNFLAVVATYLGLTVAYSLVLKRKMLIDAIALAALYTVRVVAGGAAIGVPISEWLLGFSMFMFLSLALVKRYSELAMRFDSGLPDPTNRDYKLDDLPIVASLAAASGYCAVIVLALYISSDTVRVLYSRPQILWLVCPVLLYWISRILMLSHRRLLHDDPIVFALEDRVSLLATALIILLGVLAAVP
jgi:4-hydroxybenzoate polyprenyltransferase/phosphoserine phosphatase